MISGQGRANLKIDICGKIYHFSSQENLEIFTGAPETFRPAFGGFNPYSLSFGALTEPVPEIYEISEGRLHLFVNQDNKNRYFEDPEAKRKAIRDYSRYLFDEDNSQNAGPKQRVPKDPGSISMQVCENDEHRVLYFRCPFGICYEAEYQGIFGNSFVSSTDQDMAHLIGPQARKVYMKEG